MAKHLPNLMIGSTVRITSSAITKIHFAGGDENSKSNDLKVSRRAIVTSLPEHNGADNNKFSGGAVSLVLDDLTPRPIRVLGHAGLFFVAPLFTHRGIYAEECQISLSDVMPLLPFERGVNVEDVTRDNGMDCDLISLVQNYISYGDELFQLHDFTCAVSYYEAALSLVASDLDVVGGTIIVRRRSDNVRLSIAKVDWIDNDDGSNTKFDVTILAEDGTPHRKARIERADILMSVWKEVADTKTKLCLQSSILLKLSQCMLCLAHIDNAGNGICYGDSILSPNSMKSERQEKYRQAAVLGCSIAITLCEYHFAVAGGDATSPSPLSRMLQEARTTRAIAFLALGYLSQSADDAKRVLVQSPSSKEARELLNEIREWDENYNSADVTSEVGKSTHVHKFANTRDEMPAPYPISDTKSRIVTKCSNEIFLMALFVVSMWYIY